MKKNLRTWRFLLLAVLLSLLTALGSLSCCAEPVTASTLAVSGEYTVSGNSSGGGFVQLKSKKKNKKNKKNQNQSSQDQSSQNQSSQDPKQPEQTESVLTVEEDGSYSSKEEVALYIHTYGKLPGNYLTKREAENLGWLSYKGNLWDVAPGKSIGGSRFGNYEGQLPDAKGRKYYECDIDFDGTYRNAKRIIYSNDGLIFYTEDHYKTFEQLY